MSVSVISAEPGKFKVYTAGLTEDGKAYEIHLIEPVVGWRINAFDDGQVSALPVVPGENGLILGTSYEPKALVDTDPSWHWAVIDLRYDTKFRDISVWLNDLFKCRKRDEDYRLENARRIVREAEKGDG